MFESLEGIKTILRSYMGRHCDPTRTILLENGSTQLIKVVVTFPNPSSTKPQTPAAGPKSAGTASSCKLRLFPFRSVSHALRATEHQNQSVNSLHLQKSNTRRANMVKKKEKTVNVNGKPKHSLDANRKNGKTSNVRSASTVRRLKMYNTRPTRDSKGKILKNEFQSKELPSTRIQPDRRWFGRSNYINVYL